MRRWPLPAPHAEDAAVAVLLGVPFALYLVALNLAVDPTAAQWARADPILHLVPPLVARWSVPLSALGLAVLAWRLARPSAAAIRRGLLLAGLGLLTAFAMAATIRLVHGPRLPSFVPAEESAGPGFLLSMTAGFAEEVLFRFLLVPVVYFGLTRGPRRVPGWAAAALAVLLSGLGFALLHDLGPGAFRWDYFVTRFLFPGSFMSLLWFGIGPSYITTAHAAAHLVIPLLFVTT